MRLEGLDHIAISVADPAASESWYVEVLGLERRYREVWGNEPVFLQAGASGLALFPHGRKAAQASLRDGAPTFRHLAFRADRGEFERARRRLAELGIETEFEDHEVSHSIYFDDPDGLHLEITTYEIGPTDAGAQSPGENALFRHALATLAYRAGKALRDAPEGFATFGAGAGTRSPGEILAHMGDLLDWALSQAEGREVWRDSGGRGWSAESARFFSAVERLDHLLAAGESIAVSRQRLFQGPIADALTHVGQIALLRRLAGSPVRGENYFRAKIEVGRVGDRQADPVREFD